MFPIFVKFAEEPNVTVVRLAQFWNILLLMSVAELYVTSVKEVQFENTEEPTSFKEEGELWKLERNNR